jgi:hypothetical protein
MEDESDGYAEDQPADVHEEVAASGNVDVLLNHLSEDWHNDDNGAAVHNLDLQKLKATATPPSAKETSAHTVDNGVASLVALSADTKATCGDNNKTVAVIGTTEARLSDHNVSQLPKQDAP